MRSASLNAILPCVAPTRRNEKSAAFSLPAPTWGPNKSRGRGFPAIYEYEILFIVDPTVSDEDVNTVQQRLRDLVTSRGAEVKHLAPWERRRLAYEIKGRRDGIYILAQLRAQPSLIREIERQLTVTETVLRHMVVRLDE